MRRIAILGNAGSGKSYLAAKLAAKHALPVLNLDDLFWMPPGQYVTKRPADQLRTLVEPRRLELSWIVEGIYGELIESFLDCADVLVWIDVPWEVSRMRLENRRKEIQGPFDEEAFAKLLAYAEAYWQRQDGRSHAGHRRLFDGFSRRRKHLTSALAVDAFVSA